MTDQQQTEITHTFSSDSVCLLLFEEEAPLLNLEKFVQCGLAIDRCIYLRRSNPNSFDPSSIEKRLGGVPLEIVAPKGNSYDFVTAFAQVKGEYEWLLLLGEGDQLTELPIDLSLASKELVNAFEVEHPKFTTLEPRLFHCSCIPNVANTAGGVFAEAKLQLHRLQGIGSRRNKRFRHSDQFAVNTISKRIAESPSALLHIAQSEEHNQRTDTANVYLDKLISTHADSTEYWQAMYLRGKLLLADGHQEVGIDYLKRAFDFDPDRCEPLYHIALEHFKALDWDTCEQLCDVLCELPTPIEKDYWEPSLYRFQRFELLAKTYAMQASKEALFESTLKKIEKESLNSEEQKAYADLKVFDGTKLKKQEISTKVKTPFLTVGMATHDDYDGVYFTIMSLVLYHQEALDDIEILVIDNNPESKHGDACRGLCERTPNTRYIAAGEYRGTAVRERVFEEARGDAVLCMDCHVFLHDGALSRLIEYFKDNPDSKDLLHGPIYYDNHHHYSTHMTPDWREGFFGTWGRDARGEHSDNPPFDIPMQGLGLFAASRKNWLGFNLRFRGFGGEEGYIHEKYRRAGGRVLCLPFLRWTHRFDRPNGPKYVNRWEDRVRNYLIGWSETEQDVKGMLEHFGEVIDKEEVSRSYANFMKEQNSPLWPFCTIYGLFNFPIERPILSSLGASQIIQLSENHSDLVALLETAFERRVPDVMIIHSNSNSQQGFEDEFLSLMAEFREMSGEAQVRLTFGDTFLQLLPLTEIPSAIDGLNENGSNYFSSV